MATAQSQIFWPGSCLKCQLDPAGPYRENPPKTTTKAKRSRSSRSPIKLIKNISGLPWLPVGRSWKKQTLEIVLKSWSSCIRHPNLSHPRSLLSASASAFFAAFAAFTRIAIASTTECALGEARGFRKLSEDLLFLLDQGDAAQHKAPSQKKPSVTDTWTWILHLCSEWCLEWVLYSI